MIDVEAQYRASSYAANAYSADDYDSNVNDSNPAFYSDTEANQDFAREQLRFSAAQIEANNTTQYRINNSIATQRTSPRTLKAFSAGSSASPLSVSTTNVMANGQPTIANSTPDIQPDGVYVDDNGTRHFRVNIAHESRTDPITQFEAAIQDRLDQWGADAIARDDGVSLALGGALTALNELIVPDSSVDLAIGLAAGPVLGKGLAWGMRGLEVAASRTALTSWLAADLTKVPAAVSQASSGAINAAVIGTKGSITELGRAAAEMAENLSINLGGILTIVDTKSIFKKAQEATNLQKAVLGHYPEYKTVAENLSVRHFNIPEATWNKMSEAQRWEANQKFLDRIILRGNDVILATPLNQARPGSYYARELEYMSSKGYTLSPDGTRLIPNKGK